ncbi:TetR/AcrR family transcriptional regulator [Streptomyces luteogriseus]|uniref:TetR/AcrR family transcriptional regulator n=1 Tax=Streptomyces luteogriseus TaxID=68233 RepID=UPI00382D23E9
MKTKAPHDLATAGTRERIVRTASRLMQRQGYEGTGIKQISREAGATLGSVYHFFPGGKQELGAAAVRLGDEEFTELLRETLDAEPEPEKALPALAASLAQGLRDSDWLDGCPVTSTVVGTASGAPGIQQAAAEAFARWRSVVAGSLVAAGFAAPDAADLSHTVIATLEGAELASQVARSEAPLEAAGRHLARLVASYR